MFKMVLMFLLLFPSFPAHALESRWSAADYVQIKLLSAEETAGAAAAIDAALQIRLAPGWHAYWRMPGDGGLAPVFDWSASENVKDVVVSWPAPRRFVIEGLNSFGYEDEASFPLTVTPVTPGKKIALVLNADIMVCETICVPQKISVSLEIPESKGEQGRHRAMIAHMRDNLPKKENLPSLRIDSVVIGPDALVARVYAQQGFDGADLFVESGDLYLTAPPEVAADKDDSRAAFMRIGKPEGVNNLAESLAGRTVTLTFTDGGRAVEKSFSF